MILKPAQLGNRTLADDVLAEDKKNCRKIGPCGIGKRALYLNSFYIDRRYYIPMESVTRVFKRVAMSKGGFSGKGMFASIPYLVVVYDNGKEKQCNFKVEDQVDLFLAHLGQQCPDLPLVSEEAEKRLKEKERKRSAKIARDVSPEGKATIGALERAKTYLERQPEMTLELSQSARRKRAFLQSKSSYKWVAMVIMILGAASFAYGLFMFRSHGDFAVYFTLFGLAAIFLFSGVSVLPTSKNNRKAILGRADRAQKAMADYIKGYPDFPVPARYAHPVVLDRMIRIIEDGKVTSAATALDVVKSDLKNLNADVEVEQEEYDEVVAIKPMFLNESYE